MLGCKLHGNLMCVKSRCLAAHAMSASFAFAYEPLMSVEVM